MTVIPILLAQLEIKWKEPKANLEVLTSALDEADFPENALLLVPEMFPTGFTDEIAELAEAPGGSWEQAFCALLDRHHISGLLGIVRRHGDALFNEAIIWHPQQQHEQLAYQKISRFKSEGDAVSAGAEVRTVTINGATVCPLICYDLRFPELFRRGLELGAEVFVVIASWPNPRHQHWELLLKARAIENQAFVIGVNRCGTDPYFEYDGGTMIVNPHGETIFHAGNQASLTCVEIDVDEVRDWRSKFPAVSDYLA